MTEQGRHRHTAGRRPGRWVAPTVVAAVLVLVIGGIAAWRARGGEAPPTAAGATASSSPSGSPSASAGSPTETALAAATPTPTATPSPRRDQPSLVGDTRNAWAFVPLTDPARVTIEGSVPSQRAWSTSKVLVTAAYLQTVVGGDPGRLTDEQRAVITKALTESDGSAITWLHDAIPGGSGDPVNAILRSIGDDQTFWPNSAMNSATWTIDRQLSFLVALHQGRVVNPAVSAFLISMMQPVASERWGLGTVGASAFKGGWVSAETETRQMGYLDGYAVVIITAGEGPVVPQIDGDSAHVEQMNHLAALLKERLAP